MLEEHLLNTEKEQVDGSAIHFVGVKNCPLPRPSLATITAVSPENKSDIYYIRSDTEGQVNSSVRRGTNLAGPTGDATPNKGRVDSRS
jgi:hypothetical protein